MPETKQETVPVQDLNQFVQLLTAWHENRVATMEHMLQIPDGTKVELGMPDGNKHNHELTGEKLDGFLIGLHFALMEFGQLPFVTETEAAAPEETLSGQVAG